MLNGQILVAALRDRLNAGKALHESIVEAGCRRLRPVLALLVLPVLYRVFGGGRGSSEAN